MLQSFQRVDSQGDLKIYDPIRLESVIASQLLDYLTFKVEKVLKGSLDLIPSPSPSVKIQIMSRKVCLRCKGKTLLGVVNKLLKTKSLLTSPSNVLHYNLK